MPKATLNTTDFLAIALLVMGCLAVHQTVVAPRLKK